METTRFTFYACFESEVIFSFIEINFISAEIHINLKHVYFDNFKHSF